MADAFTTSGSVGWDQSAYERLAYFAFRQEVQFDAVADVQPTNQSMPGKAVIFTIIADLSPVSTALNESVDVDAVAISDSNVTVTLLEYGNAVIDTAFLRATSFLPTDPIKANLIGWNAAESIDIIVRDVLKAGSNVRYAGSATSRNTVVPTSLITGRDLRRARTDLRAANVPKIDGRYAAFLHPHVLLDLQQETGGLGWRDPHIYSAPENIWTGEVGMFEGFGVVDSTKCPIFADSGSDPATTDVYGSLFMGRQGLAKAYSTQDGYGPNPRVVKGAVVDKLQRLVPLGWKHLVGYGRFREAALRRVESASSVGNNA